MFNYLKSLFFNINGRKGFQTLKEYSSCKTACDWACYHAVAAGYVRELVQRNINSLTTNFVAALDHLCAALTASKTGSDSQLQIDLYFHCYHGVGHAIIWVWNDLDPNNVAPIIPVNTAMTILIQYVIHCRGPTFLGENIFVELGYTCNFGKTI